MSSRESGSHPLLDAINQAKSVDELLSGVKGFIDTSRVEGFIANARKHKRNKETHGQFLAAIEAVTPNAAGFKDKLIELLKTELES